MKTVVAPGALDTKAADYEFLAQRLRSHGVNALTVDFGVMGDPPFVPDVTNAEVARAGGVELNSLRQSKDKARAMRVMAEGLPRILSRLREEGRLDGVCGMGGSGGTAILSAGMRGLPIGVPKLLVSTVAAGDVSALCRLGGCDLNAFGCRCGGAEPDQPANLHQRRSGNRRNGEGSTTRVRRLKGRWWPLRCSAIRRHASIGRGLSLDRAGWEVLVFHATGNGGRTMQRLASEGFLAGMLDLTTTELADEVCGGVFSAGPERVSIGASRAIPVVLAPGCVDMCNFGSRASVPEKYDSRLLYEWNANVTLMRTNVEENRKIGRLIAETANRCAGPAVVLLPLRGVSMLDSAGEPVLGSGRRPCLL